MSAYIQDADTNPDQTFMKDYYKQKLKEAIERAANVLDREFGEIK